MKDKQRLQGPSRVRYRCELCSIVYTELETLQNHTRLMHLFSGGRVLRQSSKKVAMAVGGAADPPAAAADANASVVIQEATEPLTDSKHARDAPADSGGHDGSGEANVSDVADSSAVGSEEAQKAPTHFEQAGYDIGIDGVVEEVNPSTEVTDPEGECKDATAANDAPELNEVKEAANDGQKKVNGVMEQLNDVDDAHAVVGSATTVLTRRSQRHHPEQRKDLFCLECLECFRLEEDLVKHEQEKHAHGDQPESNDDNSRSPEPFVHLLRWSSEENLLALSTDSEPMNSDEVQPSQTLQIREQGRKRKASSIGLAEIPAERATGKRKVKKSGLKSNPDYGGSGETATPTLAFGETQLQGRPRTVPSPVEKYWACISASRSNARSRHCKTAPQNSTDTPGRQTDTTDGQTDTPAKQTETTSRKTDTPGRQTDTTDTLARRIDQPDGQTDTPARKTDKLAKRTCTLTEKRGRQTNTLQVNDGETSKVYPVGEEASRDERHAGPEIQETGSTSGAPGRVNTLDGNTPVFLKPCSVRLLCLPPHTLETHRIKGLKGTAF